MQNLKIHIEVNPALYSKNPDSTELGRKIVSNSIGLIHELGFDAFTFKKLSIKIGSPESSIYRYFESKHHLLAYLTSWYWSWIEYKVVFATVNVSSARTKLKEVIKLLTEPIKEDQTFSHINEVLLDEIVRSESVKTFHVKNVDSCDQKGFYDSYKNVVQRICLILNELNPKYSYPHMLISTVIEGAHQQKLFAEHIPSLSDVNNKVNNISDFYTNLVLNTILNEQK
ncbi:MAG: TetR/AcrR family transcriptional regulator [Schleiferiaceae bacterium]|nr:TetR/AcrR family transcriptional regulator [Schleiferiaceae bacterium]